MCDTAKYNQIFEEIKKLSVTDMQQLMVESDDKETQAFYAMVGNYFLQKEQKKAIERNLF